METDQLGRLRDILEAAKLIGAYVKDTTETDFRADKQKQDAVIRRIEIIGEAAAHLIPATRQIIPELPFRKMRGMRNVVACTVATSQTIFKSTLACTGKFFRPPKLSGSDPVNRASEIPTAVL